MPSITRTLASLALVLPLVATGAVARQTAAADPPAAQGLEAKVDAIAAQYLAKPGGVGLSVGVARKGRILLEKGYGLADAELDVRADAQTMFRIGSITKQFTSALILRYSEQKKLAIEDDLSKFVPGFPLQGKKVTIQQLLAHTSGIPSYTDVGAEWKAKWPLELTHEELLALVKDKPFDFEPGTKWAYDNTGYYLLGMVIEHVSGKSYGETARAELFEPLGLTRTRYDSNVELLKNRAQGYTLAKGVLVNDQHVGMSQPGAAGALVSTSGDLVRWQMALTAGKVVSAASYSAMSTPTVLPDGKSTHYGLGLSVDEFEGKKRIQHGGGIFGFNSMLLWLPEDDLHVAVISNGEPLPSGRVADEIAYAALGIVKTPVLDQPIPAATVQRLSGEYHLDALDLDARVFEKSGQLFMQATGQGDFRLQYQGGDEYRADFDTSVRVVFTADGKGFTLYQGGGVFPASRKP